MILYYFSSLNKEDVISTLSSVNGADIILSEEAKKMFPYKVECKKYNRIKVFIQ